MARKVGRAWMPLAVAVLSAAAGMAAAAMAAGAELRLRSQCTAAGAIVTLGEVAEVAAAEANESSTLAAIELFPAPTTQHRFLRVRELQDLLILRGVDLAKHRLSGANQVEIAGGAARTEGDSLSASAARRAQRRVQEAIGEHLSAQIAEAKNWTVTVNLTESQSRRIAATGAAPIGARGGESPFLGNQQFELSFDAAGKPQRMNVQAEVTAPVAAVAAVRSVARGAILREADLELRKDGVADGDSPVVRSVAEAVGKETTRALTPGRLITQDSLRAPLCVRRGEPVTVFGRADGIQVRTTARAKDDGALGELIAVESLQDRKSFFARVCGAREVEVLARAAQVEATPASFHQ